MYTHTITITAAKIFTWRSRYWKLCGEGSGRPPRSEEPREPPLESGRWVGGSSSNIFNTVRMTKRFNWLV